MPRPRKQRHLLRQPKPSIFKPAGVPLENLRVIRLLPEELEALRLTDLVNLSQAEAAQQIGVSRSTFQRMLTSARRLVTMALVEGQALQVVDGNSDPGPPRLRGLRKENQAL